MPDEKKPLFVVNDRRKAFLEDEPVDSAPKPEPVAPEPEKPAQDAGPQLVQPTADAQEKPLPTPTPEEHAKSADRYSERSRDLDAELEKQLKAHGDPRKASDFEMTFEKLVASLYMTALMQLGLVHQQTEQPRVDLIGARQSIDTLSLLNAKTKGNLTEVEQTMINNCLYELRMAYVEMTSTITHPPAGGVVPPGGGPVVK